MNKFTKGDITSIIKKEMLGEGKKDKTNKQIGSTEDAVKAVNKANREAEKEAHGGVLAFQHKQVTKNKKKYNRKDMKQLDDEMDIPTADNVLDASSDAPVSESVVYSISINEKFDKFGNRLPDPEWANVYNGINRDDEGSANQEDTEFDLNYAQKVDEAFKTIEKAVEWCRKNAERYQEAEGLLYEIYEQADDVVRSCRGYEYCGY